MIIAQVIGSAVATLKHDSLRESKLLLARPADVNGTPTGQPFLAVDLVGAGEGELVIVSQGSSARMCMPSTTSPVDAAVVGILDSLQTEGTTTFRKE